MDQLQAFVSKRMLMPERVVEDGVVLFEGGKILAAGKQANIPIPGGAQVIDFGSDYIAPGFVDIHTHGSKGVMCDDGADEILVHAGHLCEGGTTAFLPTMSRPTGPAFALQAMDKQQKEGFKGAQVAAIHMEGPFLTPKGFEGSEGMDDDILPPDLDILEQIIVDSKGYLRIMGVGIDMPGAEGIIKCLRREGVKAACCHSRASYDMFMQAVEWGIDHATHLFNVMSGIHHRNPGIAGGALANDSVTTELICDGLHLHSAVIDLAIRAKGPDRLAIITDMATGGLSDGEYGWIVVKNGIAYMKGADPERDSAMAGASRQINTGVRNVMRAGYPIQTAVKMASITPCRMVGLEQQKAAWSRARTPILSSSTKISTSR